MQLNFYLFSAIVSIGAIVKASGGEVPDYMLQMKKRSKRSLTKFKQDHPEREPISTIPKYKKSRSKRNYE